jgi:hypothetical protein
MTDNNPVIDNHPIMCEHARWRVRVNHRLHEIERVGRFLRCMGSLGTGCQGFLRDSVSGLCDANADDLVAQDRIACTF